MHYGVILIVEGDDSSNGRSSLFSNGIVLLLERGHIKFDYDAPVPITFIDRWIDSTDMFFKQTFVLLLFLLVVQIISHESNNLFHIGQRMWTPVNCSRNNTEFFPLGYNS